jgi:lipopolysaccharide transport system permease protein
MSTRQVRNPATRDQWSLCESRSGWESLELGELWRYRELVYFFTWRDVLVRYKQAALGIAWTVLQPLLTMVVFTLVFNRGLGVQSPIENVPYTVFCFAGLLPWQFFAGGLTRASGTLVTNANLLTKVYFPRVAMPMAAVLAGLVDLAISLMVLLILMGIYGVAPNWHIVFVPLFAVLALVTTLAVGLWLSALNVRFRDIQQLTPFLVQLWMFVSPVIYPIDKIPAGPLRVAFTLNPMTAVIGGFRWALLGEPWPGGYIWLSVATGTIVLCGGAYYFARLQRVFADVA